MDSKWQKVILIILLITPTILSDITTIANTSELLPAAEELLPAAEEQLPATSSDNSEASTTEVSSSSSDNSEASTPEVSSSSSDNSEASTPEVSSSSSDKSEASPSELVQSSNEKQPVAGEVIASGKEGTCPWRIVKQPIGERVTLYIDGGELTYHYVRPWYYWREIITEVSAEEGPVVIKNDAGKSLFYNLPNVVSVRISSIDTSKATDLSYMFSRMTSLRQLDLSGFNMSNVKEDDYMLGSTNNLSQLTLGSRCSFKGKIYLPDISKEGYTGKWINVGSGTILNPKGSNIWTSQELIEKYDGGWDADTYVWERAGRKGTAPWVIEDDGTLRIYAGEFNNSISSEEVWRERSSDITKIVFDGPVIADTSLRNLFLDLDHVESIVGMEFLDTKKTFDMRYMFRNMRALETLDLSGFDMTNVVYTQNMFDATHNLSQITLGQLFKFGIGILPNISKEGYTGKWINVGSGTILNPKGSNIWTSQEFAKNYDGKNHADTYVWQEARMKGNAQWEIEDNGTLRIYAGDFDNSQTSEQLWQKHSSDITKIVFDGPVIADTSLKGLFSDLNHVESIVGMEFLDTKNTIDMSRMFYNMSSLSSLDVTTFLTVKVKWMGHMFRGDSKLEFLDVSRFATSEVTDMTGMFEYMSSLKRLDVSSFNTTKASTFYMFNGTSSLENIKLGEGFTFSGNEGLGEVPSDKKYTGKWRNVASGTVDKPNGTNIWTSDELMTNYSGMRDADTYVWQKKSFITEYYYDTEGNSLKDPVVTEMDSMTFTPHPEKFEEINDTLYLYKGWSEEQPESGASIHEGNPPSTTVEATYYYVYEKADKFINVTIPTEIVFGTEDHSKNITSKNYNIKNNSNDVDLQMTLAAFDKVNSDIQLLDEASPDPSGKENSARLNLLVGGKIALSSLNEKVSEQELGNIQSGKTTTLALTGTYFGDLSERHKVEYNTNLKFKAQAKVEN